MLKTLLISTVISCPLIAQGDLVDTYSIGTGQLEASIQFDFLNGNTHLFNVQWDGEMTGRGVFDMILDERSDIFDFTFIEYSFGDFLTGVIIGSDDNFGTGTPPDYLDTWKYWTAEGAGEFVSSSIGFSERNLINGSSDAWVFGSYDAPATIPAPATLALMGLTLVSRRRRASR